jgi:hypothetical protein
MNTHPGARTRRTRRVLLILSAFALLVVSVEGYRAYATVRDVRQARVHLSAGQARLEAKRLDATDADLAAARDDFTRAGDAFTSAHARLAHDPFVFVASHVPGVGGQLDAATSFAEIGEDAAAIGVEGVDAASAFDAARKQGDGTLPEKTQQIFTDVDPFMDEIAQRVAAVDAERASLSGRSLLPPLRDAVTELDTRRDRLQEFLDTYDRSRAFAPAFLGFDAPKTYLILAQNNAEMLPSGGLVTVVGTMRLDHGSIEEMKFQDAVQFGEDWLARTGDYVEPPAPLKQYLLKDTSWNLLVSTWSPDFPTAAQSAARFYQLGGGESVDGVIAINVTTLERLLEVTGPVEIPEFGVTVSASNAFDLISEHTRAAYEPQGDRKAFTALVADAVLRRVLRPQAGQWSPLVDVVQRLGEQKDMMIYDFDRAQQDLVRQWGWDGSVHDAGGDSIMVVDASVNSTKLNQVIEHSASIDVRLDDAGKANTTVTLDYFNNLSPWARGKDPELVNKLMVGGMYGGYVRLLTPPGSRVLSVKDDEGEIGVEAVTRENGLTSFGRYFSLPRDTKQRLTFTYATPPVVERDGDAMVYTLHLIREPGWSLPPVALSIAAPDGMRATAVSVDGVPSAQQPDSMSVDLTQDRTVTVRFQPDGTKPPSAAAVVAR